MTVTADDQTRTYDTADPTFTASYSGFVNGETLASSGVTGSPNLTSSDTADSPVGTYTIVAAKGMLAAQNYTFNFVSGTLTVTQEVLTVDSVEPLDSLDASSNVAGMVGSGGDLAVSNPVTLDSGGAVKRFSGWRAERAGNRRTTRCDRTQPRQRHFATHCGFQHVRAHHARPGGGTIDADGKNVVLSGGISGPGALNVDDQGTVILSGANTFSGGTIVSAGTVIVATPSSVASGSSLTVGAAQASYSVRP